MRIALCGYMGAGKSKVGRRIANIIGCQYVDLDTEIIRIEGMCIADIFTSKGEEYFRKVERDTIQLLADGAENIVISLGGGAVEDDSNRQFIKGLAKLVYIDVPFEVCYRRIANTDRPIVNSKSKTELQDHYKSRIAAYNDSDVTIKCKGGVSVVASKIMQKLNIKE